MNHSDLLYIVERAGARLDIRQMTADELEELEMLLQGDITAIRDQLAAAAAHHWETGWRADSDWFRRAKTAQSIKARQLEMVKRTRKALRDQERRAARGSFPNFFMDAARAVLSRELFDAVMTRATILHETAAATMERRS